MGMLTDLVYLRTGELAFTGLHKTGPNKYRMGYSFLELNSGAFTLVCK